MNIQIITLFPEYFTSPLEQGLLGKALKENLLKVHFANPRDYSKSGRVDDYPFGGGESMVMTYHPLKSALDSFSDKGHVVCFSPQGTLWNFQKARFFANTFSKVTLVCGRYGGIDERFISSCVEEEISVGNYILNGGEGAALVFIESIFRFLPGAIGNRKSLREESFSEQGLLQGPQWTRPRFIEGHTVPEVLFSGNHKRIKDFRFSVSLVKTFIKRPELLPPSLIKKLPKALKEVKQLSEDELKALGFSSEDLKKCLKQMGLS